MYQELSRKELQTLCKQQGIPANKSNAFMAQSLAALASPQLATPSATAPTPAATPRRPRVSNAKARKETDTIDTSLARLILSNANTTFSSSSASLRPIRKSKVEAGVRSGSLRRSVKELPTETKGLKLGRLNQVEVGCVEDKAKFLNPKPITVPPIKIEGGVSGTPDDRPRSVGSGTEFLPARVKVEGACGAAEEDRVGFVTAVAEATTERLNIEGASAYEEGQVFTASLIHKEDPLPQLDWTRLIRIAQNVELILTKTTNIVDKYKSWRQEALLE
ncbi:hypothetical protein CY35_12G094900 [Sphagnum magellanicum]|nr:hypothetical protein CY35_12G094900 [Sphagnum magellanicum]KAH9546435.1 hypothetical protein CY35_12G094900 [Sphagnum magellanicum]KAH9546436.1 hypothetical protein CY35_12G094900 [Sphagnum magellanicum]KAH9546437.1 hypothetical protein CY35_12G094900 [Sphagnum magellanicum]KAH9546438.1 hypothetical protein CY35_12G094900 [Sphagnum magellanicum]